MVTCRGGRRTSTWPPGQPRRAGGRFSLRIHGITNEDLADEGRSRPSPTDCAPARRGRRDRGRGRAQRGLRRRGPAPRVHPHRAGAARPSGARHCPAGRPRRVRAASGKLEDLVAALGAGQRGPAHRPGDAEATADAVIELFQRAAAGGHDRPGRDPGGRAPDRHHPVRTAPQRAPRRSSRPRSTSPRSTPPATPPC